MSADYPALVAARRRAADSALCVGLDPEPSRLPPGFAGAEGLAAFCLEIIAATAEYACAFKPNLAFFERFGSAGWRALERVVRAVPSGIPVIADAKRGDIGNTARAYAEALYEALGAQAITASPYLGLEALSPLLEHPRGFAYVLCRTSNPGAGALQDLPVEGEPLFARVIRLLLPSIEAGRAGLVIGAQEGAALAWAARLAPQAPLLVPGVGAQGGTAAALAAALSPAQAGVAVVSASRSLIHAESGPGFAAAAGQAARELRDALREALPSSATGAPR